MKVAARDIAKMIDHSLLRPELTVEDVVEGCKLAAEYDVATVCVKPSDVGIAQSILKGTDVLATTGERAGADFVKTSTGFAPGGATIDDLKLMRATVSEKVRVKAVRAVGTVRFGATATKQIVEDARKRESEGTLAIAGGELAGGY